MKEKGNVKKTKSEVKVIQINPDSKNGQNKCPKCGSTDISMNMKTGKLRCEFCRNEFEPSKVEEKETDISQLKGHVIGTGATDISKDAKDIVTLKCSGCGAEVVIDTSCSHSARCHWCRNILSINQQVPNGSVPDMVLPFKISKEDAQKEIETYVGKRKFFVNPKFKQEFTTENIMGVYFPYMVVDINAHVKLIGQGEHLVRSYLVGDKDNKRRKYDADLYNVEREFDFVIDDLTIESSSDKLNKDSKDKTTNIINAIMPFDIKNAVKWDANYIRGFTSEKRDTNIEQLQPIVNEQSKDIARIAANETLKYYDRGVCWSNEEMDIKGQAWKAAYLPVWLYSYQQVKGDKRLLHYVAVNARTKEIVGSVPIHMPKLWLVTILIEFLALILMFFVDFDYRELILLLGPIFFSITYIRYRNSTARHKHELETKNEITNQKNVDTYVCMRNGLSSPIMSGANNKKVSGQHFSEEIVSIFINQK